MADKSTRFAARLKELRKALGLTQLQLAEKTGLNQFGIAKLEQGHREPAWGTVVALSEVLGVPCQAFLEEPAETAIAKVGRPSKAEAPPAKKPKKARK
jgi:transcriptional regulator with XRE-family HTH domain